MFDKERVLILGTGFLGSSFKRCGYTVWDRSQFEFPNLKRNLEEALGNNQFDVVINAIGNSNTRECENPYKWFDVKRVNGDLPEYLSDTCAYHKKKFVHISTGCVYDQKDGYVTEESPLASHCRYVVSKLLGEFGCDPERDLIIRPRLLFDSDRASGRNNLIQKFEEFDTFLNEFNSVTSLDTIIESIEALLTCECSGVYNVANRGVYTIADMAEHLGFEVKSTIQDYDLCSSQELILVNNVMSVSKLIRDTGYSPSDALYELKRCYENLKGEE